MKKFEDMIKFIIFGLILNILFLYKSVSQSTAATKFIFWNNHFIYSPFVLYLKIFISIIAICIFISMLDYFKYEKFVSYELPILILLCMEGMFLIISANDYFVMYVALELQSIPLYILAVSKRYSNVSVEAGLKYFVYGSFASGVILYGISLIYGSLGVTDFSSVLVLLHSLSFVSSAWPLSLVYGFVLIACGLFFKLGLVPMHWWVPEVYEGASTIVTFFFSTIPKISILFMFYRVFSFCLNPANAIVGYSYFFLVIFSACAVLSIFFGSVGAIYQTKIKSLLAYSTIANFGFMLLGLTTVSVAGLAATMYYLFIYILASIQIFYIIAIIRRQGNYLKIKHIVEFAALANSNFTLSMLFVLGLLSFAGVPPMIGFFGKFLIFNALISNGQYLLAVVGVLFSVLTCVYYIRLIRFIWFSENGEYPVYKLLPLTQRQSYFLSTICVINFSLFFFQGPLLFFFHELAFLVLESTSLW